MCIDFAATDPNLRGAALGSNAFHGVLELYLYAGSHDHLARRHRIDVVDLNRLFYDRRVDALDVRLCQLGAQVGYLGGAPFVLFFAEYAPPLHES